MMPRPADFAVGQVYHDRHYPLDTLHVVAVLKTRVKFECRAPHPIYSHGMARVRTYDAAHLRYLAAGGVS